MRRVRSRLTILLYILVIAVCLISLLLSYLVRANIIMVRDPMRYLVFGIAFRDILIIVVTAAALVLTVTILSRTTTDPIRTLNHATKEIAAGNFDVQVAIRNRAEEFAELQDSFNLMARELKSNEYLKKEFVSGVSHELKTPLSIIGGYARLLREEDALTPEERREYVELIIRETERLTTLTSNMLRLSRMDSEELQPKREAFSLDEQIRSCILLLEPRWSEKALELDVELPELSYTGDMELMGQVWSNLLSNAVKYTEPGGHIQVVLAETPREITVLVKDDGCGMTPETAARVFERFYQGDTSHRREGSGLGLAIARRICQLHGGDITVESAPGEGSAFTVRLPLPQAAEANPRRRHRNRRRESPPQTDVQPR